MAAAAATIAAYIALVGPLTTAITQVIELSKIFPTSSNVPSGSSSSSFNNMVNIGVGMYEGGDQNSFGGDGVQVSGFTNVGTFVGSGHMPHMDQGQSYTTGLDPSGSSIGASQAWQLTLRSGGSNAVCVQFVELAWQQSVTSGFDGTWGKMCGQDWYYSESTWGLTSDNQVYRPDCFWLDDGKKPQHPLKEMWADMGAIVSGASVEGSNTSTATYCNDQVMKFSSVKVSKTSNQVPAGLNQDSKGSNTPPSKRSRIMGSSHHAAPSAMPKTYVNGTQTNDTLPGPLNGTFISINGTQNQLVISDIESHSAKELCAHPNSRGPDFVSQAENLFCDMTTRAIHSLCTSSQTTDCFSIDYSRKRMMKRDQMSKGIADDVLHRDYKHVQYWQG
ncbi:MAG: hypothetical protein Q9191_007519 [Dirinaria sp. TL-2023a]